MDSLPNLIGQATKIDRDVAMYSSLTSSETKSGGDENPPMELEYRYVPNFYDAIKAIDNDGPGLSVYLQKELKATLTVLKCCGELVDLKPFDQIRFYRGGLPLMTIFVTVNNCGRSACLDLNDYRANLSKVIWAREHPHLC